MLETALSLIKIMNSWLGALGGGKGSSGSLARMGLVWSSTIIPAKVGRYFVNRTGSCKKNQICHMTKEYLTHLSQMEIPSLVN